MVLWATGVEGVDQDVYLQPREAQQLVLELQWCLGMLTAGGALDLRGSVPNWRHDGGDRSARREGDRG